MNLGDLTAQQIRSMNYNELISVVRETNRPPGGVRTISNLAARAHLGKDSHVLEIGTSTGITAIELARLVGCRVTAIDINERSIAEARRRAESLGVAHLITFEVNDATATGYPDDNFDMVFCGNVTSLIPDRAQALAEYSRVVKPGGFIAAIPMYYVKQPSEQLLADVTAAIQVTVEPLEESHWLDFFLGDGRVPFTQEQYTFDWISDEVVDSFVRDILARPHLDELSAEAREALVEQYAVYMRLFRDNLSEMGYTELLVRCEVDELGEPELFTASPVLPRS
ncbi:MULTISPECIES: class I SAM-dependent methyltransferase [unclassified Streptomyces]|uniref:class I SAM-dependent methyltransferase n=1 Tax=unclassified Streptomyces TaxID=2593676 RepID=UPI0029ACFA88|nr:MULTISPECIES: class I SAM-dependent methyltransferase [unclassified Streptomyces]MDX3772184.1 class I SAM-dependent methyltransferase [Streptomyces sp. AK08-01B]MDX3821731.1 class I SAM-dependent methyltransferase [Streptomyces sp. AK08-01A]